MDMSEAMRMATATEVQNNFGKYLQYAIDNGEVLEIDHALANGAQIEGCKVRQAEPAIDE